VKEKYPMANGATMEAHCKLDKCKCWAEFGMKTWSGIKYQSCKFLKKATTAIVLEGIPCLRQKQFGFIQIKLWKLLKN